MSGTCRYGADVSRGIWSWGAISLFMTCNYVFSVKKTPNMENSKKSKVFFLKTRQKSGVCLVSEETTGMNRSGAELFIDIYMYALFFRFWTIFGVFSTKIARFLQNPLFAVVYIYII